MRTSSAGLLTVGLAAVGLLAVAGCQEEGEEAPTVAQTQEPTSEEVTEAPDAAPTTEPPVDETGADETGSDETADGAATTTAATVTAAPTVEEPTATSEAAEDEGEEADAPGGDVTVVQQGTFFTTPAQAAFCSLSAPADGMGAALTCEVGESSVPPGEELMGFCPSDGYGWYFNFFEDVGHAGFFCNHHDGIVHLPGEDLADDPWVDQSQVHVTPRGTRVPILGYGRVLQAGSLSCGVQPDGLTCSSQETGQGFTVNTASYVSW